MRAIAFFSCPLNVIPRYFFARRMLRNGIDWNHGDRCDVLLTLFGFGIARYRTDTGTRWSLGRFQLVD